MTLHSIHQPAADESVWNTFSAAPHRMMFFAGALQIPLVMLLWFAELLGRAGLWLPFPMTILAVRAHLFLMLYGVFSFFIFGFLLTVYPRWMAGQPIAASRYVSAFLLLATGMILFYLGLFTSAIILIAALVLYLAGWAWALYALFAVYYRASKRGVHERLLNFALVLGMVGIIYFLVGVAWQTAFAFRLAVELGVWLFLLPVVFLVAHRMIPFFSQSALINYIMVRPAWGPPLMLVCATGHALLELSGHDAWRFLADAPLAIAALQHSWVWQFRRSFHTRLLAMLHIAFLWLGIGMTLYTLQSLALLITGIDYFGRAPLHALGIGFFTGMVVAMASRVTLGHSGRALEADNLTWRVLFGVNLAALLRISAEFMPAASALLNVSAAAVWLASFLSWAWLYAPMYWRRRVYKMPG